MFGFRTFTVYGSPAGKVIGRRWLKKEKVFPKNQLKNFLKSYRQHQLRWSYLEVLLLSGSVPMTSSQFPTPWWWWCHRRPCRKGRMLPWTQRSAPQSIGLPIKSKNQHKVKSQFIDFILKFVQWKYLMYIVDIFLKNASYYLSFKMFKKIAFFWIQNPKNVTEPELGNFI